MQKHVRHLMLDPNLVPSDKLDLISRIASFAGSLDMPCYLVGGFIRDLLLHKPVNDYDIVVEGDAIGFGKKLVGKYGGHITSHGKFRTAIWITTDHVSIDLITARSESYIQPGALPTIRPSTILDDLRRRDFAINAMAVRLDGGHLGEVLDILSGLADLENGIVRVLHPRSFIDDPTRIFRAVRYEQRYGFAIEPETLQLINNDSLEILSTLSGERLRHEFDLIFLEDKPGADLIRLQDLGVLAAINPNCKELNMGMRSRQIYKRMVLWV